MNDSITSSRSAWTVKWPSNKTEADQGSNREVVYTVLESEQFVCKYYYQGNPLCGADSESNQLRVLWLMKINFQTNFCYGCFFHYSPEHRSSDA
jgi:hypothetical protein